jgi:hypothetical protein
MNILHNRTLSRRTVLRGLGTAIALPWLEAMAPRSIGAASGAARPPVRLAFLYVPNGMQMSHWTPTTEGADYKLPELLTPLAELRDEFSVLSGLAALQGGHDGGNHAPAMGAFLTGAQPRRDARCGISADQLAAAKIGHLTRLPSLQIGCKRTGKIFCDGFPCVITSTLSWASPTQPLPTETSPRAVFDRLFGTSNRIDRHKSDTRRSILDTVRDEAASLCRQVSAPDRHKLDEYLTALRDVEQRIYRAENMPAPKLPEGTASPEERIPNNFAEYVRLLGDLMVLAFQTDVTRICSFIFDSEGSVRSYPELGINAAHHDLSHHNGKEDMVKQLLQIERHHVTQLAYILGRLKQVREGDGTLLDNCLIAYGCALGDGNRHDHQDLPILLAGKGGGTVRPGRHIRYPSQTPVTNLWLSMLDRAGASAPRLGDSTGLLPRLD